ncbi:MAG: hypothetical protein ACRD0C_02300 [Acidimicrobiia bacterium]
MSSLEEIDAQLVQARADGRRLASLKRKLDEARRALAEEGSRATSLASALSVEAGDVAGLEGHGLRRWLASLAGTREERLAKEQAELAAAKLRYGAATRTVAGLRAEIERMADEIRALGDPAARFAGLLDDKEQRLVDDRAGDAGRLADLATRRADAEADRRELDEAMGAGRAVRDDLSALNDLLRRAGNWGTYDLLGGGLFATMIKHDYMDDARDVASRLQQKLLAFDRELSDVEQGGLPLGTVDVGSGLRFADYLLDGLIADWMVQSRITRAAESVAMVAGEVNEKLRRLQGLVAQADEALRAVNAERAQILAPEAGGPVSP